MFALKNITSNHKIYNNFLIQEVFGVEQIMGFNLTPHARFYWVVNNCNKWAIHFTSLS